jgi:hypothetical protein
VIESFCACESGGGVLLQLAKAMAMAAAMAGSRMACTCFLPGCRVRSPVGTVLRPLPAAL